MRVITGIAKGKKLTTPKDNRIRPTTDRIKESLFNIISPYLMNCNFLDCFSGTGSMGIEAISRGANISYFIDNHRESIQIINKNIKDVGFDSKSEVLSMDVREGLKFLSLRNMQFDVIFMDPPYQIDIINKIINDIFNYNLLTTKGIIVAEHDKKVILDEFIGDYHIRKSRAYGKTSLTIYER